MHVRPLFLASLLVLSVLAGCIGADEEAPQPQTVDNSTDGNDTYVIPEGRDAGSAYEETNATEDGVGGMAHDHDYWNGKTRVQIMDEVVYMHPGSLRAEVPNYATRTVRIPQPGLVYEGTETVEVTISEPERHVCNPFITFPDESICTSDSGQDTWAGMDIPEGGQVSDPSPPATLRMEYKHAATTEWVDAGEITWDTPLQIPITDPIMTDMPHSVASLWIFKFTSDSGTERQFRFRTSVEIVKGDDVPEWPGHPDFYADSPWRKVYDGPAKTVDKQEQRLGVPDASEPAVPTKLISWGTETLHVWVNISSVSGTATPESWFLEVVNATGGRTLTESYPTGETSYYFVINVDDNGMDTPYADGSRWNFMLQGAMVNCVGGCADFEVDYNVAIVATNEVLPDEEYTPVS